MKIRPLGAELFLEDIQIDRRGDMTKLIVTFCYSVDRTALSYLNPHLSIRPTIRNTMFHTQEYRLCKRETFRNYTSPIIATPALLKC